MPDVRLGLIGDNISRSQAPRLHRLAGGLCGLEVSYERLVPTDRGKTFDELFEFCATAGFRGINVTYPYKELAAKKVGIDDPLVRSIGAVNTVIFTPTGPKGFNTDYSGFVSAYRRIRSEAPPGIVCMLGAGGVGKAVAFGLLALGLGEIRIVERDLDKAEAVAEALRKARPALTTLVTGDPSAGAKGAAGLVNCTPIGMVGYEGTPLHRALMAGAEWAFDAVYTPIDTQFLQDAEGQGLTVISGYELFFFQGVDAWDIFVGRPLDQAALRRALAKPE